MRTIFDFDFRFTAKLRRGLVAFGVSGAFLLLGACSSLPKKTYYCRDENNQPLEGALVICRYSGSTMMAYFAAGADYRFSDNNGVVFFGDDEVTKKLPRNTQFRDIAYTYSPRLRSGGGVTNNYNKSDPFPGCTSYSTVEPGVICFRDNRHDPAVWLWALYHLTREARDVRDRIAVYGGPAGTTAAGVARLDALLGPFIKNEWKRFFDEYGTKPIPMAYFSGWLREDIKALASRVSGPIKFNDLKPLIEKLN